MYRPWYAKIHWPIATAVLLLAVFGGIAVYSATFREHGFSAVGRQAAAFGFGLILSAIILSTDYSKICNLRLRFPKSKFSIQFPYFLYACSIFLLVLVLKKGESILGSRRWISLGPLGAFEPSEFAKLAVLLAAATYFAQAKDPLKPKSLLTGIGLVALPSLLVMVQPDLGTSIILGGILVFLLVFLGLSEFCAAGTLGILIPLVLKVMKPYQRERLLIFLHPEKDPAGSGYNIIQSLIAVGSGKFLGEGLFAGTQTQLKFVPEHSTDFIFTVIAEETGFLGSSILLILYLVVFLYGIDVALKTEDTLGKLLAGGITAMLFLHVFINIGMVMGIMPITGIPLPFVSAGGSSLVTDMMAAAFLLNIDFRRDRILPASSDY